MKEEILQTLRNVRDAAALRAAIIALCTPLAEVRGVDLIPGGMAGTVLCRVEPSVLKDGEAIAALFDGSRIGNAVYFSLTVNAKDFAL